MRKPRRVRRKVLLAEGSSNRPLSKEELVTRKLYSLGFRRRYKGFFYLREEILLAMDNEYKRITKLHEEVALKHNKENPKKTIKPSNIESCIRVAIKGAWKEKKEKIQKLTGEKERPTVGRMVFEIARKMNNDKKL